MLFRSRSTRPLDGIALFALAVGLYLGLASAFPSMDELPGVDIALAEELYLSVYVNEAPQHVIVNVTMEPGEGPTLALSDLERAGLRTHIDALTRSGRIALARLPDVAYEIDHGEQTLHFYAADAQRVPRRISVRGGIDPLDATDPRNEVKSDTGAVLNYALTANGLYDFAAEDFVHGGLSGAFESWIFSPIGALEYSFALRGAEWRRLDTAWTYSDPHSLTTYRVGDVVTGSLPWTRPTRLGGVQVQRNFDLRSGVVTMPLPGLTGSAALPSTVDVFVDNTRRFSRSVPAGPFEVLDIPVVSGAGAVRMVVRDDEGNETVTESDYFASSKLLRQGLLDYSAEVGFPRIGYGSVDDRYDSRLFGSASIRYGITDWLTLEGHAEVGEGLINSGLGSVASLGDLALASFSGAFSSTDSGDGAQFSASIEFDIGEAHVRARTQHTLDQYEDIASFTAPHRTGESVFDGRHSPSLHQLSITTPLPLDRASLSLSYTYREHSTGGHDQLLGASFSAPLLAGTFSAAGFSELGGDNFGVRAGLSLPMDNGLSASTSARSSPRGTSAIGSVTQRARADNDHTGWNIQYEQRVDPRLAASAHTHTPVADVAGRVRYGTRGVGLTGSVEGAVAFAGGGVHLSRPISDAFAVVDVGAANVPVTSSRGRVGVTGADGTLLVPNLRSFERNSVSVDPAGLPLDVFLASTRQTVIPGHRSGVVLDFKGPEQGGAALVSFIDAHGRHIPIGSTVNVQGQIVPFLVGHDGEAFVTGLFETNRVVIELPNSTVCEASFTFTRQAEAITTIRDVPCHTIDF